MAKVALKPVTIYSDGACSGNPGPGGYGVILDSQGHRKEISGGRRRTTNNRMELMGAIVGLEALKEPCSVTLITDSQYVVNGIEKGWAARWRARGWMRNAKERALNPDLWQRLLDQVARHEVRFRWVRGHAGHAENERCDALAVAAASRSDLQEDHPSPS
ncbi:MAG: ribonuclease HI [Vicinamibacteria bacterium]|nr:ribonuclease HI [Vicinamibacteria bacterium]